ncbi:MAG TPA: hypothetical protein VM764_11650, partial [Gemmatimonadaceae bacterium]|nr:hypothetical protein [Gemmatimonadaceae bacterium]
MNLTSARRLPFLVLAFGLSLLSCGREITGPDGSRLSALALDPRMPMPFAVEGSGSVVPFVKVRVTLERADGTEALERIVDFGADTDTLQLALEVPLPFGTTSAGIPLTLRMQYINAQGDTVFRAGPVIVMAVPLAQGETPSVVSFDVQYVGVGADAAFLDLSPIEGVVVAGTTTTFTGTAYGANENELPGTPIIYSSPDADKVQLSPTGVATWLPVRGSARVIASLPTGIDADTATMTVSLPATKLAIVSGNSQSAAPGSPLSASLVLRVTASDDVPVEGVTVTFAVFSGGGVVTPSTGT